MSLSILRGSRDGGGVSLRAKLSIEKAKLVAYSQRWAGAIDSVNTCNFIFNTWSMFGIDRLLELVEAVTGWEFSMWEFMLLGERKLNMLKLFNEREGFTEADDVLPGVCPFSAVQSVVDMLHTACL